MRDCRRSADHDLSFIRVFADAAAHAVYTTRSGEFPEGAVLLKEQYDAADPSCGAGVVAWTVMVKETAAGDSLGWRWQEVDERRRVAEPSSRCHRCHQGCTGAPEVGYRYSCAEP